MNIYDNPSHIHTHVCELSFLLYCLRLLVFLVSHLEASVVVVHNVESEWTILKQELYTRWVTLTHSKNGITHLEFNWCRSSQLSYNQVLVYTCTFIVFLVATSLIPWPGRPSTIYTGLDAQTYWMLLTLIMSLLAGTSECEREYSDIKSQYRNTITSTTITIPMTIQLHSTNIADFDVKQAIHQWNLHYNRRPNVMEAYRRREIPET